MLKGFSVCPWPATWSLSMFRQFLFILLIFSLSGCLLTKRAAVLQNSKIKLLVDDQLRTKIISKLAHSKPLMEQFQPSEFLMLENTNLISFKKTGQSSSLFTDSLGAGQRLVVSGRFMQGDTIVEKKLEAELYKDFPQMMVIKVSYTNKGRKPLICKGWVNGRYMLSANDDSIPFWSLQAASYEERPDWVLPVRRGYFRENYQGMNASDYGGGVPVVDLWRKDAGLAVGHLAMVPKLVSLPVRFDSMAQGATLEVKMLKRFELDAGKTVHTLPTFVAVHQGDFFTVLQSFSRLMQKRGMRFPYFPKTAYEPIWCAWGYERNFTVSEILRTLPEVKKLGLKWVVLDDGWQTAEGDWFLNRKKFPHGDKDMRAFTDAIHAAGLKAKLWIAPLAADPNTKLLNDHPDMLLLNKQGQKQLISWWNSWYLCPAYEPTRAYFKALIQKILIDWNFDGLKLDGQHQNAAPPCYNPLHHHKRPEESVEAVPSFFKMIYETAVSIKPEAVVEICPCGDAASFYNMTCENQPVASDPTSSWQIRLKGKVYKALMGESVPYYGDHVELSDGKDDFASTVGIGGVPGTKFTWPVGTYVNKESGDVSLTKDKEKEWGKWLQIYREHNLPAGRYLGALYDIGYDKPETYTIQKGDTLFYAFYARQFNGKVHFKGLKKEGRYRVYDYEHGRLLGTVPGDSPEMEVEFLKHLLVWVLKD